MSVITERLERVSSCSGGGGVGGGGGGSSTQLADGRARAPCVAGSITIGGRATRWSELRLSPCGAAGEMTERYSRLDVSRDNLELLTT